MRTISEMANGLREEARVQDMIAEALVVLREFDVKRGVIKDMAERIERLEAMVTGMSGYGSFEGLAVRAVRDALGRGME